QDYPAHTTTAWTQPPLTSSFPATTAATRRSQAGPQRKTRRLAYDPWVDDRAWTESWMSMNRIDHNPGSRLG
ncbi:MAG TPA: hypothetical protein VGP69_17060, partial [Gaiellaceae bacterium]|nr:hypothetical protein [Gaiellaceae bacterium]